MQFGRRQFLGAIAASAASMICERGAAQALPLQTASPWGFMPACNGPAAAIEAAPGAPALLPRALAALEAHGNSLAVRDTIGIVDFSAIMRNAMRGEIYLGAGVLFILAILLVPLPAWFMDFLLAISIISAVLTVEPGVAEPEGVATSKKRIVVGSSSPSVTSCSSSRSSSRSCASMTSSLPVPSCTTASTPSAAL